MAMQPSANFYHPSGRKLPSSILNQTCSCGVYRRSHSAKGRGNKAAVRAVGAGPLVRLVWPPCQLSSFPKQLYLPFGVLNSV
jgi:hypothetical protein